MAGSDSSQLQELSVADKLDNEISKLRDQVSALKRQLNLHTTTLLTSPATISLISSTAAADDQNAAAADSINPTFPSKKQPMRSKSSSTTTTPTAAQRLSRNPRVLPDLASHHQRNLYRACATATAFRARDPDPCAVDDGRVLGLRIEVMTGSSFLRAFFVLLNRPYNDNNNKEGGGGGSRTATTRKRMMTTREKYLRIHRHTIPPCIPLSGLAARWLPPPPPLPQRRTGEDDNEEEEEEETNDKNKQDLARFVRALRRELVRYQNRASAVGDLRRAAGLSVDGDDEEEEKKKRKKKKEEEAEERGGEDEDENEDKLIDISVADPEARHVKLEWRDGRTGRMVLGDGGEVRKVVVQGENGRDRATARRFMVVMGNGKVKKDGREDEEENEEEEEEKKEEVAYDCDYGQVRVEDLVRKLERGEI